MTPPADREQARLEEITARNVRSVVRLEHAAHGQRNRSERVADAITGFCGSMHFVWTHVLWFAAWIAWNAWPRLSHFDPFPYALLTFVVSLEAIFLSTFILVSENRQARVADRRNLLDLQVNLLAEQENTKMLRLLVELARRAGIAVDDAELAALTTPTDTNQLAAQIERTADKAEQMAPPNGDVVE